MITDFTEPFSFDIRTVRHIQFVRWFVQSYVPVKLKKPLFSWDIPQRTIVRESP